MRELERIPLWRNDPQRLARLSRLFSVSNSNFFNPNTAHPETLRAVISDASPAQLDLVMSLRQADLLSNGAVATRFTGLAMDRDDYLFVPGFQSRLTVWAPGLPRAFEYTVKLTPADPAGPWVITDQRQISRPDKSHDTAAALAFPLALAAQTPPVASSSAAP